MNPNLCDLSFRSGLSIDKGDIFMIFSEKTLKNNLMIHKSQNNSNECRVKLSCHQFHCAEHLETLNCAILGVEMV